MPDLLSQTTSAILQKQKINLDASQNLHVIAKLGLDGSGSHTYRHQLPTKVDGGGEAGTSESYSGSNLLGTFLTPLAFESSGEVFANNSFLLKDGEIILFLSFR